MKSRPFSLKQSAHTVYIVGLIIALGYAVGFAAHAHVLVKIALPHAVALVLPVCWPGRTAELISAEFSTRVTF